MAETGAGAGGPGKPLPTAAEKQLLRRRRQELDYWKNNAARLGRRNLLTGLTIGAFVVGMCILHTVSASVTQGLRDRKQFVGVNVKATLFLCVIYDTYTYNMLCISKHFIRF